MYMVDTNNDIMILKTLCLSWHALHKALLEHMHRLIFLFIVNQREQLFKDIILIHLPLQHALIKQFIVI